MPTVLEVPDTTQETTSQCDYGEEQTMVTSQPPQRHGCGGSPQLERGVDILAREYPFLHALAMVG
jgi:hypothetical protein